jgi:hypothetical protein
MPQYKSVKLSYTADAPSAKDRVIGGERGVDLSEVNELCQNGWRVHSFSDDEAGCWQEAILVKEQDR